MGGGYVSNAGVYLVNFVFGLYILAVLLRFLLQLVRADFYNPICQAIVSVTNPPIRPMRRYIPAFGGIDTSSLLLLVLLQLLNTWLVMTPPTWPKPMNTAASFIKSEVGSSTNRVNP